MYNFEPLHDGNMKCMIVNMIHAESKGRIKFGTQNPFRKYAINWQREIDRMKRIVKEYHRDHDHRPVYTPGRGDHHE